MKNLKNSIPSLLFIAFCVVSIYGLSIVMPETHYPFSIEASHDTDTSVFMVAVLTFIAAGATLLVSWWIKNEATEIGNTIVTNNVIHRYIDRMLHEYTKIIHQCQRETKVDTELPPLMNQYKKLYDVLEIAEKHISSIPDSAEQSETEEYIKSKKIELRELENKIIDMKKIFVGLVSLNASLWFNEKFPEKKWVQLFDDLTPGENGKKFAELIGFDTFTRKLKDNVVNQEFLNLVKKNRKDKTEVRAHYDQLLKSGAALFEIMKSLGWRLEHSECATEDMLEQQYEAVNNSV
jgi:hypothetical protein